MKRGVLIALFLASFVMLLCADPGVPTVRAEDYMKREAANPAAMYNNPPSLVIDGWGDARYASLYYTPESETNVYWPAAPTSRPLPIILSVSFYTTPTYIKANGKPYRAWIPTIIWHAQLANQGFIVVCPDVLSIKKDMASVMSWLREKGASLGADPSKIGFIASSANPQIIPYMMTLPEAVNVRTMVLFYPEILPAAWSPMPGVAMLIVKAGKDSPGRNSKIDILAKNLRDGGTPIELITYDDGGHSFDVMDSSEGAAAAMKAALEFFSAHLK